MVGALEEGGQALMLSPSSCLSSAPSRLSLSARASLRMFSTKVESFFSSFQFEYSQQIYSPLEDNCDLEMIIMLCVYDQSAPKLKRWHECTEEGLQLWGLSEYTINGHKKTFHKAHWHWHIEWHTDWTRALSKGLYNNKTTFKQLPRSLGKKILLSNRVKAVARLSTSFTKPCVEKMPNYLLAFCLDLFVVIWHFVRQKGSRGVDREGEEKSGCHF